MKHYKSIRRRILILSVLFSSLLFLAATFFFLNVQKNNLIRNQREFLWDTGLLVAQEMRIPLWLFNPAQIQRKSSLFFTPSLDYMEISDKDGLPLAILSSPYAKGWSREKLPPLSFKTPIYHNQKYLGQVLLAVSPRKISSPLWRSGLFFASSSLFLILVINTLLAVFVRRYLQELQDVTSRLELSDTPQPIQIASSSELYPIVSLINDLIAQVGSALKDREKYQSLLEETIDQRRRRLLDNIRRIEELQREFQTTKEKLILSEKQEMMTKLFFDVNEKIQLPLRSLIASTEEWLSMKELSEEGQKKILKIYASAEKILTLLDQMASLSSQARVTKASFSLACLVVEAVTSLKLPSSLNVRIEIPPQLRVFGNYTQLREVFTHLVRNSWEALREGDLAKGTIRIFSRQQEAQEITLTIEDNGPGFQDFERIFTPFYTTKVNDLNKGMGLPLTQKIVSEHGGSVRAFNSPSGGACVEVSLPTLG